MAPVLQQISVLSGAEMVFKTNCFEINGLEQEVRAAVMSVLDLEIVQVSAFSLHLHSCPNSFYPLEFPTRNSFPT